MPRILTVDDSRVIRSIVSKQMSECGFQVAEAEDGEKGLVALSQGGFDLVLLDVTMPVLDGPGMLAKLRASGDKTPVIMLTSESHSTIVAGAMKLGIGDYILKPFKPEELRAKVLKVLKLPAVPSAAPVASAAAASVTSAAAAPPVAADGARPTVDVLLIDDMENVAKKFRAALPESIKMEGATSAQIALTLCREKIFKAVVVDMVIPEVNSVTLMKQVRALQPTAACLALMLRSTPAAADEVIAEGFDGVVFKPFDADNMEEFVHSQFGNQDLLTVEDNVLRPAQFTGKDDRLERYFSRLRQSLDGGIEKVASACFDEVILDLSTLPLRPDRTPRLVLDVSQRAAKMGMELRLVGTLEVARVLDTFTDTSAIPLYASVADARSGGARLQRRGAA